MIFLVCVGLKADNCLYSFEPRKIPFDEPFAFATSLICGNVDVSTDQLKFSKCEWNMIIVTFVPFSSVALIRSEYQSRSILSFAKVYSPVVFIGTVA